MQTVCNTYGDAGKGNLTGQNTRKPFGGRGSAPNPAEGAYSAPANPLVGEEGLAVPSPRTPPPLSALRPRLFYPHSKISSDAVDHGQLVGPPKFGGGGQMKSGGGGKKNFFGASRRNLCPPLIICFLRPCITCIIRQSKASDVDRIGDSYRNLSLRPR